MKKGLALLLTLVLITAMIPIASAESAADSGTEIGDGTDFQWSLEEGVLTVSGTGALREKAAMPWENRRGEIEKIILTEGVTGIPSQAFRDCTSLTEVVFPSSLNHIGSSAFSGCTTLQRPLLPAHISEIGSNAFLNTAFYQDPASWSEEGVLYLDNWLLEAKTTLSGSYAVRPDTVGIADWAFRNCTGLTDVVLPHTLRSVGYGAFYQCTALKKAILPNGLRSLGSYSFYGCSSLNGVRIPNTVTMLSGSVFAFCSGLKSISLPSDLQEIGVRALLRCTSLRHICFEGSESEWNAVRGSGKPTEEDAFGEKNGEPIQVDYTMHCNAEFPIKISALNACRKALRTADIANTIRKGLLGAGAPDADLETGGTDNSITEMPDPTGGLTQSTEQRLQMSYEPSRPYRRSAYYQALQAVSLTGDQRTDIINVALSQAGYTEGDTFEEIDGTNRFGRNNYSEPGYWFGIEVKQGTQGHFYDWCAMFASWCARQARIPESIVSSAAYAKADGAGGSQAFVFHMDYAKPSAYTPKPGDFIFFGWENDDGWDHVGLVRYAENGLVYTIEGNAGDGVRMRSMDMKNSEIFAYGKPAYQ